MKLISILSVALALCTTALPALADTSNQIAYRESLTLKVGEAAVVYGYRGDCGALPVAGQVRVPALKTGALSIGKPGVRESRRCNGITPAYEIIFTATAPGRESFELQGDRIRVVVTN
jgi:hypothetical protein